MSMVIPIPNSGEYVIGPVAEELSRLTAGRRTMVISDRNVHAAHPELFDGANVHLIGVGEESKTLDTVAEAYRFLEAAGADRGSLVVGIGGGIVTDVAGFVASTFMRGIEFGFVSTTLLGQVDASVGGKNGVNLDRYKNMVGCFRQPRFVIADPAILETLPEREFRSGMAEVIKAAVIASPELFSILERNDSISIRSDRELLERVISLSVGVKAGIVSRDAEEKGLRRVLNLGHTVAHAIEHVAPRYNHGEAVAIGLVTVAEAALHLGRTDGDTVRRICSTVERYGLPTEAELDVDGLMSAIGMDKKRDSGSIHLIIPNSIGSVEDVVLDIPQLRNIIFNR